MASTNKCHCLCLAVIFIFGAQPSQASSPSLSLQDDVMYQKYEQWLSRYGRLYTNSAEKETRFQIFKDNVAYIESSNSQNKSYKLSINHFADLTNQEFKAMRTGSKARTTLNKVASFKYENVTTVLPSMDWRARGAVTLVEDQGHCLSCWAFSAVACTEGLTKITTGKLVALSAQELVDCNPRSRDGCQGGYMDDAFQFIVNNGLSSAANYSYVGTEGTCSLDKASAAMITGYEYVPHNDESALLKVVSNQPVTVGVESHGHDFQFYSSGVFNGECGTEIDHFFTVVGYGTTVDSTKYWLVKNSWGTDWGTEGYIQMGRDVSAPEGQCGIAMEASYPIA